MTMEFRPQLIKKAKSMWLLVVLNLYINMRYFNAAQYVDDTEIRFRRFIVDYNRTYAGNSTEYAKRLAIFAVSSDAMCEWRDYGDCVDKFFAL